MDFLSTVIFVIIVTTVDSLFTLVVSAIEIHREKVRESNEKVIEDDNKWVK